MLGFQYAGGERVCGVGVEDAHRLLQDDRLLANASSELAEMRANLTERDVDS